MCCWRQEADRLCNAQRYERREARRDTRAGHYERKLKTKAGEVRLRIPELSQQTFETAIIERYRRRESSVEEALIEMYPAGVLSSGSTPPRGGRQRRSGGRDRVRSALHAACAIDRLWRREAASSVRSPAYCGRVRARSSISHGRWLARSLRSNGLKLSVLFHHPTNANSIAWQHLPKVLINRRYQIGGAVALRLRTQGVLALLLEDRAARHHAEAIWFDHRNGVLLRYMPSRMTAGFRSTATAF